ncbi:ABC transporter permease [Thiohalomonas denitrificans]|uniref:ABC-2 type transport system permease protein n=1 Tax=Thiohalomonas denitrificans TaxID=415747 RepID=A0A1G5Q117_9GAMM|nr:ABC transporter permease [Thiohalomonas denitrificans]SCZ55328.1 ABC-2 type transport system permease protein [Thiohalomonas denitrificans]
MKGHRIGAVITKERHEILRDPVALLVALLLPMVLLFLFGYAISLDVKNVDMGVLDRDRSAASRSLVESFTASGYFRLERRFAGDRDLNRALQSGEVRLALVIPPDFRRRLTRQAPAEVQVLVDGTYSATALVVANYAQSILAAFGATPSPRTVRAEMRVWYNPSLRSVNTIVPGLYAVILMAFPPLLTTLAIVREKERGTVQQIYASPLTSAEFIIGKLIPYGLIAFLQIGLVMLAGYFWFRVPLEGAASFLLATALIYVFCTVGIGLLISTVTRTQLSAVLLALIFTLMPSFLFSGFLFPIFTMPYVFELYTALFPARYFVVLSRGVSLKGAGIGVLWFNTALLAAYTLAVFALAAWRLKKKVA